MPCFKDMAGETFGRLTVIRPQWYRRHTGKSLIKWICSCECGRQVAVLSQSLRKGATSSCGCLNRDVHTTHGMTRTKTYKAWEGARSRCQNPNASGFSDYGAREISMCSRWATSFESFLADMGACPPGHSLERIDFNGDYEPINCKWIPLQQQQRNRRSVHTIEHNGERRPLSEWARIYDIPYETLRHRCVYDKRPLAECLQKGPLR